MNRLDQLLELIKNGTWHHLDQIAQSLNIPPDQLARIAETLKEQDILRYRPEAKQLKINPNWLLLTERNQDTNEEATPDEQEPPVATLMIPPRKTVTIQNLQITNATTETPLELYIRILHKQIELTINKVG
ncbi:MAG: hypothetical protein JSV85_05515 [Candidatus Bathyarchaeota archaeon]|nr:MAG: hypothetical protein JSV85_05515 [Candidatus Bathyarchaeota archaeon]